MLRDNRESILSKRCTEEELSASTYRGVARPCSLDDGPRDSSRDTERQLLLLLLRSGDHWSPRPELRRMLSRQSASRVPPVTVPCLDVPAAGKRWRLRLECRCSWSGRCRAGNAVLDECLEARRARGCSSAAWRWPSTWRPDRLDTVECCRFSRRGRSLSRSLGLGDATGLRRGSACRVRQSDRVGSSL